MYIFIYIYICIYICTHSYIYMNIHIYIETKCSVLYLYVTYLTQSTCRYIHTRWHRHTFRSRDTQPSGLYVTVLELKKRNPPRKEVNLWLTSTGLSLGGPLNSGYWNINDNNHAAASSSRQQRRAGASADICICDFFFSFCKGYRSLRLQMCRCIRHVYMIYVNV